MKKIAILLILLITYVAVPAWGSWDPGCPSSRPTKRSPRESMRMKRKHRKSRDERVTLKRFKQLKDKRLRQKAVTVEDDANKLGAKVTRDGPRDEFCPEKEEEIKLKGTLSPGESGAVVGHGGEGRKYPTTKLLRKPPKIKKAKRMEVPAPKGSCPPEPKETFTQKHLRRLSQREEVRTAKDLLRKGYEKSKGYLEKRAKEKARKAALKPLPKGDKMDEFDKTLKGSAKKGMGIFPKLHDEIIPEVVHGTPPDLNEEEVIKGVLKDVIDGAKTQAGP